MDSTTFGIMLLYFLMPGHLEYLLQSVNNRGNMGLYGVYNDIYIKRNVLYSSPIYIIVTHYYGYPLYGIFVFILVLASFVHTCNKWKDVIFMKEHLY